MLQERKIIIVLTFQLLYKLISENENEEEMKLHKIEFLPPYPVFSGSTTGTTFITFSVEVEDPPTGCTPIIIAENKERRQKNLDVDGKEEETKVPGKRVGKRLSAPWKRKEYQKVRGRYQRPPRKDIQGFRHFS